MHAEPSDKQTIAIYLRYFLSPSETFVYRQLQGIATSYRPIVLTASAQNRDLFPFDDIYVQGKGFVEKVTTRLERMATRRFSTITLRQRRQWMQALRENRVAMVHAHFGHFGLDILPVARELEIPLLVTFHGFDASSLLRDARYTAQLRELFEYAHVITVSQNMLERLEPYGAREERTDVHYIGVPVGDFDFVERRPVAEKMAAAEPIELLQVSNFVEKKGHRYTIEAFATFVEEYPAAQLTLAGDGPRRDPIERRCKELGLGDRVRFTGRVVKEKVRALMHDADVFLHHSVTGENGDMEGLPTVLMEAMSMGLVCVSTRHSGIPELIEDGTDGYLVDERDVEAYAAKLGALRECARELPGRARQRIELQFDMAKQNDVLSGIYAKVIRGHE